MAFIYRLTNPSRGVVSVGHDLLPEEIDDNWWEAETRLAALEADPPHAVEIQSIEAVGSLMVITLTDYTTFSIKMPVAAFQFRGPFIPNHDYKTNDLLTANDSLYIVNHDFTSGDTFVFGSDGEGPWYAFLMPFPNSYLVGLFFPGLPGTGIADGRAMLQHVFAKEAYLPKDLVGSFATLEDAPVDDLFFPLQRGVTVIGSINFAAYENIGTFTLAANEQFEPGDTVKIMKPLVLDIAATDLTVTLLGKTGTP